MIRIELVSEVTAFRGPLKVAREIHEELGGSFRAPHHTVSQLGLAGELAIAAGGVMLLDEASEFRAGALAWLLATWTLMPARPVLVVDLSGERFPENLGRHWTERVPHSLLWTAIERAEHIDAGRSGSMRAPVLRCSQCDEVLA